MIKSKFAGANRKSDFICPSILESGHSCITPLNHYHFEHLQHCQQHYLLLPVTTRSHQFEWLFLHVLVTPSCLRQCQGSAICSLVIVKLLAGGAWPLTRLPALKHLSPLHLQLLRTVRQQHLKPHHHHSPARLALERYLAVQLTPH